MRQIEIFKHSVSIDFWSGLGLINTNFTLHTKKIVKCDRRFSWCYRNEPWERQLPLSLVMPVCPEPTWWKESADSFLKVVLWHVCVHHGALSHTSIYTQNNKRNWNYVAIGNYHHRHFCTGHVYCKLRPVFPTHQIKPLSRDDGNLRRTAFHWVFLLSLIGLFHGIFQAHKQLIHICSPKKKVVLCCHLGAIISHTFLFRLPQGAFKAMNSRGRR